ncbi:MAG: DUF421 domain-containing protein [Flavobacteriales bacterium]
MEDLWRILMGDHPGTFLLECVVRTLGMAILAFLLFKFTGKKEVRQFSVLELLVIIGLGSALGDPMMYDDVPLLPSLVVIAVVLVLYRLVNHWANRDRQVGRWVEGAVVTVFKAGRVDLRALHQEGLSMDEFLGELRVHHVEHLGQVRAAHMEVDGHLSVFFRPDEAVVPGLPTTPDECEVAKGGQPASCRGCGFTLSAPPESPCPHCQGREWLQALDTPRCA